jgi:hypothetical protein
VKKIRQFITTVLFQGALIAHVFAVVGFAAATTLASHKQQTTDTVGETYFVDGSFSSAVVPVLKLENKGDIPSDVLVQRFAGDGSLVESMLKTVIGKTTTNVRLEKEHITSYKGWIKVVNTQPIIISGTFEMLQGNTLRQIQMTATKPEVGPLMLSDEIPPAGVMEFVFVNLSDYPVHVSWCQQTSPAAACGPASDIVGPKALKAYAIDNQQRYAWFKSESCVHISGMVTLKRGSRKTFGSDSSVSFDAVK